MSRLNRARAYLGVRLRSFFYDRLLRRVLRNTSYLFAGNAVSVVMTVVTANLLGAFSLGSLKIIIGFVTGINRLLSFRMSESVVRYVGEALKQDDRLRAAALLKAAAAIEGLTSLAAFLLLALLAPLGALFFAKGPALQPLFLLYGVSILANLIYETSTGFLQVTGHFRSQALINLAQSVLVAGVIVWISLNGGGLVEILLAYLLGKLILGMGPAIVAILWLPRTLGADWWRAPMHHLPPWRELAGFGLSTNFSATINLIARDSEAPWLGLFFGPQVVGYYSIALTLINLMVMPVNPLISTSYPEIARAWAARRFADLRYLLRRISLVAGAWTGAVALGLLLFGQQLLFSPWIIFSHEIYIYDSQYQPAFPILIILLLGYGAANIFFWNRPLLLAQGRANLALKVSFWAMLAKLALGILLLPRTHYLVEAGLLSAYFLLSVGWMVWAGLSGLEKEHQIDSAAQPARLN
jgi:O-antigen/teichoic acid export membrane protein